MNFYYLLLFSAIVSAKEFSGKYKVLCPSSTQGCYCYNNGSKYGPYYHYQPIQGESGTDEVKDGQSSSVALKHGDKICFMDKSQLSPIYWTSDMCPNEYVIKNLPFKRIEEFLDKGSKDLKKLSLGKIFPTFYNIASESYHPGKRTVPLYEASTSKIIAWVTPEFRDDLDMEGTGVLEDGRILNVGTYQNGKWKYVVLPSGTFGLGIYGHYLYPSRTVAIDFDYICKKTNLPGCSSSSTSNRKKFVGALLYIPKFKGVRMANGFIHDGYVCAQDIGGAIKQDRVDIFVGPMGGGNPYLTECRYTNHFIAQGINGLVPYDWRTWVKKNDGYFRPYEYEYRKFASNKALEIFLVNGAFCKGKL